MTWFPRCLYISLTFLMLSVFLSSVAFAQKKKSNVVELSEITITGRVQKPVAAVDISRIAPKLSLAELRQPFLDRIEKALYQDPFLLWTSCRGCCLVFLSAYTVSSKLLCLS